MFKCLPPKNKQELEAYYDLRWKILRAPWQQEKGSERDDLEQQSYHRVVLNEQNNIVAVGRLNQSSQFDGHIRFMAVDESVQGQGVGKLLLLALESVAREAGIKRLYLAARESAIGFYQNLGYESHGFSHTLYGEVRHEKMEKSLSSLSTHEQKNAQALEHVWHTTIPMSKAMNLKVSHYDRQYLMTHCDLLFNKNLHNTMFAGSIYTHATLTGWAWVYFALQTQQHAGDIVLAEGSIRYLAPLAGVAYARTSVDLVKENSDTLAQGKNARFTIQVEVCCGDTVAAVFSGLYVAVLKR